VSFCCRGRIKVNSNVVRSAIVLALSWVLVPVSLAGEDDYGCAIHGPRPTAWQWKTDHKSADKICSVPAKFYFGGAVNVLVDNGLLTVPAGTTYDQMAEAVVVTIETNPHAAHQSAALFISAVLRGTWGP
jgi:hypothetical protein